MLDIARLPAGKPAYHTRWTCPSNIAIVKYWGKREGQLPANPSVSLTLEACYTDTTLDISPRCGEGDDRPYRIEVQLDGQPAPGFVPKIEQFFDRIAPYAPYLRDYAFVLHTSNSFPHSSGIASSASGLGALAACLVDFENACSAPLAQEDFLRRVSFYARLGSGSASRSIYPGVVLWGECPSVPSSSDLYAVPLPEADIHPVFRDLRDTVLLIEHGAKSVSSTAGHALMKGHPYAPARFAQAREHVERLREILRRGDVAAFGALAEREALTLHAMMMAADPCYILFKPATIAVLDAVWQYRKETLVPLYFTLDAGANVHLLYPASAEVPVREFLATALSPLCQGRMIHDRVGTQGVRKAAL